MFLKILECIMYNRFYTCFTENEIIFEKQLGFRGSHATDHALLELIDQICDALMKKSIFFGIFVDLSKVFNIVDYEILLKKLEKYRICGKSLL